MAEKKTGSPRVKRNPSARGRKSPSVVSSGPHAPHWSDDEIARLAYSLWERRGRPMGSPDEDWHQAKEQLKETSSLAG